MKLVSEDCMPQLFKGEIVVHSMRKRDLLWGLEFDTDASRIVLFFLPFFVLLRLGKSKEFGMLFMGSRVTADLGT